MKFDKILSYAALSIMIGACAGCQSKSNEKKAASSSPNIIFIMSDDHAAQAITAYGGIYDELAPTPNIDRLAEEGIILHNVFCTNAICGPSRACILTGKYNEGIPAGSRATMESMSWLKEDITQEKIAKVILLKEIADELNLSTAQLAIAWLLRRKEVSSVITGASKLSQLEENLAAREAVESLTDDLLERIEKILDNDPLNED